MADNALDVLERDHHSLGDLFEDVGKPGADRAGTLREIISRLAEHIAVERSLLLPVVRERGIGGADMPDRLVQDYQEMERLLVLIERRKINSPDVPVLVTELMDIATTHTERADAVLHPALRQALAPEELEQLGTRMLSAENVILSHPHPHMLSLGPLSRLTTRLAGVWDQLRDRTVNNRTGTNRGA